MIIEYKKKLLLTADDRDKLYEVVSGDGRYLLNICEGLLNLEYDGNDINLKPLDLTSMLQPRAAIYDPTIRCKSQRYDLLIAKFTF